MFIRLPEKSFLLFILLFNFGFAQSVFAQSADFATRASDCPTMNPAGTLVCPAGKYFTKIPSTASAQCHEPATVTAAIKACINAARGEVFRCSTGECVCPVGTARDCRGGGMNKCLTTAERDTIDTAGAAICTPANRTYNNCAAAVTGVAQCGRCIAGTELIGGECLSIGQVNSRVTTVDTRVTAVDADVTTLEAAVTRLLAGIYTVTGPLALAPTADGFALSLAGCAPGQVLKWDGATSRWACADDLDTDTNATYIAAPGGGLSLAGTAFSSTLGTTIDSSEIVDGTIALADLSDTMCAANQVLKKNAANNDWVCAADNGSQWTVNGSAIYYAAGNVGIGSVIAPTDDLHIQNAADASLVLEADTDNAGGNNGASETDNAWLLLSQDNGATKSILGTIGVGNKAPDWNMTYTGAVTDNTLLGTISNHALQLGTNSNVRLTIENGGDVGIGTANPTQKLEVDNGNILVQGSDGADADALSFSTAGDEAVLYLGDTNHYMKSVYGSGVRIGTSGVADAIALQQTTGNVGIGTTDPSAKLDVVGATELNGDVTVNGTLFTRNGSDLLSLKTDNANHYSEIRWADDSGQDRLRFFFDHWSGTTNDREVMSLLSTGNVGIGTVAPESPLEISSTSDGILRLRQNEAGTPWNYIEFYNSGAAPAGRQWWVGQDNEGDFRIFDSDAGAGITVENGGNIGIGTTNPEQKLDVQGGAIRQVMNSTYDVWMQGGSSTSGGDNRNLILLGTDEDSGDTAYLNYNGEYGGGTQIGGNTTIGGNLTVNGDSAQLPDESIQRREMATNSVTAKQILADSVNAAELNYYFDSTPATVELAANDGTGAAISYCDKGDYALAGQCWATWTNDSAIDTDVPYSIAVVMVGQNVVPAPNTETGQGWRCAGKNEHTATRWLHAKALCINNYNSYMLNLSDYPDILMPSTTLVSPPQIYTNDDLVNPYLLDFDPSIFYVDPSLFFIPPSGF